MALPLARLAALSGASLLALALAAPLAAQETAPAEEAAAPEAAPEAAAAPADAPTRDSVVATVNGVEITLGEVLVSAAQLPQQYQMLPPEILFPGLVDQLVQQELLAQTLDALPPHAEIALAVERRTLAAGEVIESLTDGALTEEAVQAAYDAQYAGAEPTPEWNASHILVGTEEEAQAVVGRLEAGEDFAAVAQEVSTDTGSGAQGGELGWFGPGMMVPEFEAGVAGLEAGQVSAPVQSQFGWHVIRLNETREQAVPPLEEVRGEIEAQLRQEAVEARVAELTEAGEVARPPEGTFDPATALDPALLSD